MSVDQALLESVEESKTAVLRIYRWAPATLSLGYFQTYEDRMGHLESSHCDLVRRASGGGAIIHDQEITYSLTVPSTNRWAARNTEIYRLVHDSITEVLKDFNVAAYTYDHKQHPPAEKPNSFLCFQRRYDGDLICDGYKVVGSAQRRNKQAVLQHGSILLGTSDFAPQLPGINELAKVDFDYHQFSDRLVERICHNLSLNLVECKLYDSERKIAESYSSRRFNNDDWNIRRKKNELSN